MWDEEVSRGLTTKTKKERHWDVPRRVSDVVCRSLVTSRLVPTVVIYRHLCPLSVCGVFHSAQIGLTPPRRHPSVIDRQRRELIFYKSRLFIGPVKGGRDLLMPAIAVDNKSRPKACVETNKPHSGRR